MGLASRPRRCAFAWSRDGKRLAIGRVTITNDIVLFRGLRPSGEATGTSR
jgi:hypothetical protein